LAFEQSEEGKAQLEKESNTVANVADPANDPTVLEPVVAGTQQPVVSEVVEPQQLVSAPQEPQVAEQQPVVPQQPQAPAVPPAPQQPDMPGADQNHTER